jgi:EamA domain-containing membrane protein RarD
MTKQDLDITEVWGVFLTAFGITLSDVEATLKIVSLILAIAFTLYKFRKEIRKDNRNARKK